MSHLSAEVRGSGPALVLLHGWGLNARVWDGLAAALCDRFRIIAVDLPGHGRSAWIAERSSLAEQAAQVRETVSAIATEYSLLGWSLGGQIALQLAAADKIAGAIPDGECRPEGDRRRNAAGQGDSVARRPRTATAVNRLVLIAATARFLAGPDWPHGAPPERLAAQAAGLETDYRRTVSDFLELQVRGSAGGAEALQRLRAALFAHGGPRETAPRSGALAGDSDERSEADGDSGPRLAALIRDLELLRDSDLRPLLPCITLPTLVIAGQYDRVTHPAASRALADSLPDARYVEIRRAAHAPFLSHMPELDALLSGFLLRT